jgi:hypothetical protein
MDMGLVHVGFDLGHRIKDGGCRMVSNRGCLSAIDLLIDDLHRIPNS